MKRVFLTLFFLVNFITGGKAAGQAPTPIVPQSVNNQVFNAVSTPQASGCLTQQGQNVFFLFYAAGGATANPTQVQIRLEGSFNSDAATCSTGTWFPISDDGTDPGSHGNNLVLAIDPSVPFIRANLLSCGSCSASSNISAFYSASSAMPGNPFGAYAAGQQNRKILLENSTSTLTSPPVGTPYGSSAGFMVLQANGGSFTTGTLIGNCITAGSTAISNTTIPNGTSTFVIPQPAVSCLDVSARCASCAAGGVSWNIWWIFYPPGGALPYGAQPPTTQNSETTATNATASIALTPSGVQRAHVFSVSARCSAGSAQLSVVDTTASANLFTSGTTEVSTTTFRYQWNPGLAGTLPGDTITVSLSACGAADVGTLDVQGSIF